jgi:hypothetical protein
LVPTEVYFLRKLAGKMAAQRILSAPSLTLAVESIVTMPMEAGSGVMAVVVFFAMENNGEIGTDSDHFVP